MVQSLWLVWQNPQTRTYYHVGTLSYYEGMYEYSYTYYSKGEGKIDSALENGYMLHPAFPDPNKIYKSKELFAAFDRRLPSPDRVDFIAILSDIGLDENYTKMDLLQQTRGRLANDTYSFENPLRVETDGKLHTSFFVHGMRYYNPPELWSKWLEIKGTLQLKREPENNNDPNAVKICTNEGKLLGYVPRFYSKGISALLENGANPLVRVAYVNEKSTPHWWVKVTFESEIPPVTKEVESNIQSITELVAS